MLEICAGDKLVRRFLAIDKLSTAYVSRMDRRALPVRYGVLEENLNGNVDTGEKRVYFEFSDYATPYVFFEPS